MAMTSCSNDEVLDVNTGEAINFRTAMGSRATELVTNDLKSFYAIALTNGNAETYFANVEFKSPTAGSNYTSDPEYYWPTYEDAELNFYAWQSNGTTDDQLINPTITPNAQPTFTYTPDTDVAKQGDVIVADAQGKNKTNGSAGVALTFKHALSQIVIKAKNGNATYDVKVKGVKIVNVAPEGTVTIATDGKTEASGTANASYVVNCTETTLGATETVLMGDANGKNGAMLIPQELTGWAGDATTTGSYIAVLVDINSKAGANIYPAAGSTDGFAWVAVAIDGEWERNYKYTYTLDFTNGVGEVAPEEDDESPWNPGDEIVDTENSAIKFSTVTVETWEEGTVDNKEL